ncbi:MAG: hypothetical protein JOZ15_15405 [Acidobacteria bacterium]|nr:hypothetical protein [Acidobacteriota bacterium]
MQAALAQAEAAAAAADVEVDVTALRAADPPRLRLLDGRTYDTARSSLEVRGQEDFTWRGRLLGDAREAGTATLTVMGQRLAGLIFLPPAVYRVVPVPGGGHHMERLGPLRSGWCATGSSPPSEPGSEPETPLPFAAVLPAGKVVNDTSMPTRFDVMELYTPAALVEAGGVLEMRLQIQSGIDALNTSLIDSQIGARAVLVDVEPYAFQEGGRIGEELARVIHDPEAARLRRRSGADVVQLVVATAGQNSEGVAAQMVRADLGPVFAPYAYSVVTRASLTSLVPAHEIGHNLGCDHDPPDADTTPAVASWPYAYGHYVDGLFSTVMSYTDPCQLGCPPVPNFSNPDVEVQGQPTGISGQRDNHLAIENDKNIVAAFMTPQSCMPGPGALCLGHGRFKVEVAWENQFNQTTGSGVAVPRTDEAGFFTFGDPANVELLVKILDFGSVLKLFYGELTDLKFALIVTDTRQGLVKYYQNTPGDCGGIDQQGFPKSAGGDAGAAAGAGGPGAAGAAGDTAGGLRAAVQQLVAVPAPTLAESAAGARSCGAGADALCLLNGRFSVAVDWSNPGNGQAGHAHPVSLASDVTGAFYFTDPGNLELLVKLLQFPDRVAFFYGTLSNLDYTITVTDRSSGAVKSYHNPAGQFCGGLDNHAF